MDKKAYEVKDSIGTIIGDNNQQTINFGNKKENPKIPIQDNSDYFVLLGRWIVKKYGIKKFYLIIGIPLIIFLLVFVFLLFPLINISKSGNISTNRVLWLIIIGVISSLLGNIIRLLKTRTCENCKAYFSYRNHKPLEYLGKTEYKNSVYHNIKQFLKCDFCGHELEHEYIDEESK